MHGRRRIYQSEEIKRVEREKNKKKLEEYKVLLEAYNTSPTLESTEAILRVNPEHYTAWNKRRLLLTGMTDYVQYDLALTQELVKVHPKSYWLYNHRKWLLTDRKEHLQFELKLCEKMLELDCRNFHVWDHRRWVLSQLGKSEELTYTYKKICENFSNYSAWHYRSKILEQADEKEFELVKSAIFTEPNDQSPWLYYNWLMNKNSCNFRRYFVSFGEKLLEVVYFDEQVKVKGYKSFTKYSDQWWRIVEEKSNLPVAYATLDGHVKTTKLGFEAKNEISDLEQLLELEPESKNCLSLLVELKLNEFLYRNGRDEGIGELLDKISTVDKQRLNLCKDLIFMFESVLNKKPIPNTLKFFNLTELDLSNCAVTSTRHFLHMPLRKLNLDGNKLNNLEGLLYSSKLKVLSVKNNMITSLEGIKELYVLKLDELYLEGNVINGHVKAEHIPHVKQLDGIEVKAEIVDKRMSECISLSLKCAHTDSAFNVGCVITDTELNVLSTGFSRELEGNTHAEECALSKLQVDQDLVLFTSMIPCIRRLSGKKSCSERIKESKAKKIYYCFEEPNKFVQGNTSGNELKQAGIELIQCGPGQLVKFISE